MAVSVLTEALVRWQHAAGPCWPYVCAAPFLATGEGEQLVARVNGARFRQSRVSPRRLALANELLAAVDTLPLSCARGRDVDAVDICAAQRLGGGGSALGLPEAASPPPFPVILADLPAEPLLAVAPLLSERGWYVVPVVQRWIATPAVLPCRQLIERLLLGARRVHRPSQPRGAILIADGERTGPAGYPLQAAGRTFDNRYEYQICRFPSTRFLYAQGVRQVTWITAARPPVTPGIGLGQPTLGISPVARDLHPYREMLLRAGIDVAVSVWQPG